MGGKQLAPPAPPNFNSGAAPTQAIVQEAGKPNYDDFFTSERKVAGREFLAVAMEMSMERTERYKEWQEWLIKVLRNPIAASLIEAKRKDFKDHLDRVMDEKAESAMIIMDIFGATFAGASTKISTAIYRLRSGHHLLGIEMDELDALAMVLLT